MTTHGEYCICRQDGDVRVIEFSRADVLDPVYIENVGREVDAIIEECDSPRILIDFNRVHFLSSAALGVLIATNKAVEAKSGRLCVANVGDDVYTVFKLTKFNKAVKVFDDTDRAMKYLRDA